MKSAREGRRREALQAAAEAAAAKVEDPEEEEDDEEREGREAEEEEREKKEEEEREKEEGASVASSISQDEASLGGMSHDSLENELRLHLDNTGPGGFLSMNKSDALNQCIQALLDSNELPTVVFPCCPLMTKVEVPESLLTSEHQPRRRRPSLETVGKDDEGNVTISIDKNLPYSVHVYGSNRGAAMIYVFTTRETDLAAAQGRYSSASGTWDDSGSARSEILSQTLPKTSSFDSLDDRMSSTEWNAPEEALRNVGFEVGRIVLTKDRIHAYNIPTLPERTFGEGVDVFGDQIGPTTEGWKQQWAEWLQSIRHRVMINRRTKVVEQRSASPLPLLSGMEGTAIEYEVYLEGPKVPTNIRGFRWSLVGHDARGGSPTDKKPSTAQSGTGSTRSSAALPTGRGQIITSITEEEGPISGRSTETAPHTRLGTSRAMTASTTAPSSRASITRRSAIAPVLPNEVKPIEVNIPEPSLRQVALYFRDTITCSEAEAVVEAIAANKAPACSAPLVMPKRKTRVSSLLPPPRPGTAATHIEVNEMGELSHPSLGILGMGEDDNLPKRTGSVYNPDASVLSQLRQAQSLAMASLKPRRNSIDSNATSMW